MSQSKPLVHRRAFATAMAILFVTVLTLAAWQLVFVMMLTFAAILLAILLRHSAQLVVKYTPLKIGAAMLLVILLFLALVAVFFWFAGPRIGSEAGQVWQALPDAWDEVVNALEAESWGSYLLNGEMFGNDGPDINLVGMLQGTVSTTFGIVVNLVIVVTVAIYLALDPRLYRAGVQHLFPKRHRERSGEVLEALGRGLWNWMLGQAIDMLAVGILIALGLWLLGAPLPISLGVIAGVTNFIPYVGPFIGAAPAIIIAFSGSPELALWTAGIFLIVQQLDAHVLMPIIQKRATSMPPALTILIVVVAGSFFGLLGVLLATPFLLVILTLVQMLYVEGGLKDYDVDEGVVS